ncbi:hypothetical protein H3Z83_07145 [Tenacibaculum sp. S7007]|uniref:Nucleotidyltransferase family protein n=1 Tax=Tenacibaculum pelagium TaxID=2759527 RepID=A0A839AP68_9FLAO|nr:hypothetical protein [Tenacibaculum pelagium]MBA6156287.1 hypothetical protein [Tenacibaculum pelagium]
MESFVDKKDIHELFKTLEEGKIEYALLRNIGGELPKKLSIKKDIDIIVHPKDIKQLISILKKKQWSLVKHPWDFGNNFIFLYSMDPFLFFKKNQLHLDVCFQLSCRSLNNGEWFPLDEFIQESIWINRVKVDSPWKYILNNEDYFIHLVTRSIFDKKKFVQGYVDEIERILPEISEERLIKKLELVFFKYTSSLMKLIKEKEYKKIRTNYIKYSNY